MLNEEKVPLLLSSGIFVRNRSVTETSVKMAGLHIDRPVYRLEDLNQATLYEKPPNNLKDFCREGIKSWSALDFLMRTVPVLSWLPRYNCKEDFFGDLISGITVGIMHIPQGMAYGLLGNLQPINGIYMAFFPVLIYFIFGTSRHGSIGTFAIVCLMTGKTVSVHSTHEVLANGTVAAIAGKENSALHYTNMEVAATVTLVVAIFQLLMYLARLGIVAALLSETLVNGFTCASAFHVVSTQFKDLFGLPIHKRQGYFRLIYTTYDAILAVPQANRAAVAVTSTFVVIMVINNEILKPLLAKKTKIPIPIELLVVIVATVASYVGDLNKNYGVTIVGDIPTGLPAPSLPTISLIPDIIVDAFVITMVSYSVSVSMGLLLAQKGHYEIDANQELLALGLSNTCGSFFTCMPVTASLARSHIQYAVGGKTQITSLISCGLLLLILLWIGPLFEMLPKCVLASIIVVALKNMLMQCMALPKYWKLSKVDGVLWLVTFCTTAFIAIDIGLLVGIIFALLNLFLHGYTPYTCLLGVVPNTDLYLDMKRYKGAQEISGLKIFHYGGVINFASKMTYKKMLFKRIGFDPVKIFSRRRKHDVSNDADGEELLLKCVVFDFSAVTYVDPAGVQQLRQLIDDFKQLDIEIYVASCSGPVFEMLIKCDRYEGQSGRFVIFPTIHDAVAYAKGNLLKNKST